MSRCLPVLSLVLSLALIFAYPGPGKGIAATLTTPQTVSSSTRFTDDVDVSATDADVTAITLDNSDITFVLDASGKVTTTLSNTLQNAQAEKSYGIASDQSNSHITNEGRIAMTVSAAPANDSDRAYVYAYGLYGNGASSTLINKGQITLTGVRTPTSASSLAYLYGMSMFTGTLLDNQGTLTLSAQGYDSTTFYGMGSNATGSRISNSGTISLEVSDSGRTRSYGIYGRGISAITNTGPVSLKASHLTGVSSTLYGLYAENVGTVTNEGTISIQASDSAATTITYGIFAEDSTLTNSGAISVSTEMGEAYGLFLEGNVTLTNTGMITASGSGAAYELYVYSGTTTLAGTYNITLDGDPDAASIRVGAGATLALNSAALTVSYVDSQIQWDTDYTIFENSGTISGNFGSVSAVNPNVSVSYSDQGTPDASDDTVSLSYGSATPSENHSPFAQGAGLTLKTLTLSGGVLDQRMVSTFLTPASGSRGFALVADSDQIASDAGKGYLAAPPDWYFFTAPYATILHSSASPTGYEARSYGASFGAEHNGPDTLCGFHLGAGNTNTDYMGTGMAGNHEDQDLYTAGVHAMGRIRDWTWRVRMTGFTSQNDYTGLTGLSLDVRETATYRTNGVATSLAGGYVFSLGHHLLAPEAGLDYIFSHRQGFTTDAADSAWNMACDALDTHEVSAVASLRWMTETRQGAWTLQPTAALGLRRLLSDRQISVRQAISGNAPFTVTSFQDDLAATFSAGLRIFAGSACATDIAYDGEFGEDTSRHSLWAKFSFAL